MTKQISGCKQSLNVLISWASAEIFTQAGLILNYYIVFSVLNQGKTYCFSEHDFLLPEIKSHNS